MIVCAALLVSTIVLWLRSYWRADYLTRHNLSVSGFRSHVASSQRGVLTLRSTKYAMTVVVPAMSPRPRDAVRWKWFVREPVAVPASPFAFEHASSPDVTWSLSFPHWIISIACAVPMVVWWFRWHRPRDDAALLRCQACGYDLRATPERCPECGTAATTGLGDRVK
jgi:hypothetical protein